MTTYRLSVLDKLKKVRHSINIEENVVMDLDTVQIGKVLIMVTKGHYNPEAMEKVRDHTQEVLRKALKMPDFEVIVICDLDPDDVQFLKISEMDLAIPKKPKSLHSRRIKRRKFDSTNTKKKDVEVNKKGKEKKEVPKEEASRGDEEEAVRWPWPF